jgi:hypothetical protein
MDAKYIVIRSGGFELLFNFPPLIQHAAMLLTLKRGNADYAGAEVVSAGFITPAGGCHGRSISLGVESRPEADTKLLQRGCV